MRQADKVLYYMRTRGSITSMEAFHDLKVTRLSGVIFNLKRTHRIHAVMEYKLGSDGEPVRFARYYLEDGDVEASGKREVLADTTA